jgi:hypothetical protein
MTKKGLSAVKRELSIKEAGFDRWFKFLIQYVAQKCGGSTLLRGKT